MSDPAAEPEPAAGGQPTGRSGRPARPAIERLVRVVAALRLADDRRGVSRDRLAEMVGYEGAAATDLLLRDLRHLRHLGWRIDSLAEPGEIARYRLVPGDPRLRVRLSRDERRALRRVAAGAGLRSLPVGLDEGEPPTARAASGAGRGTPTGRAGDDEDPPFAGLDLVLAARRDRALLRFRYNGKDRVVHPYDVAVRDRVWLCLAYEPASGIVKTFDVARMSGIAASGHGAFPPSPPSATGGLDPLGWPVDPPADLVLVTDPGHEADVAAVFGPPLRRDPPAAGEPGAPEAGGVRLTYRVTNRLAVRARLLRLGPRARVVEPPALREDLLGWLRSVATAPADGIPHD